MRSHTLTAAEDPRLRIVANRRICASLTLQQLLYYQFYFDIAWITFWVIWLVKTYWRGIKYRDSDTVRTVMLLLWLLAEPLRMAAGWYGNLQENVPWLVLFVLLSIIPLHGPVYYIMLLSYDTDSYNKAVQVAQAILLESEVVFGIWAVRRMYRMQRQQFYLFEYAMGRRKEASAVKTVSAAVMVSARA